MLRESPMSDHETFGDAGRIVVWQIPPGTTFSALPPHWTCPNCSATKDQFLVLPDA
jgi:rubredoxin